jgi:integral membrane protein
MGRAAQAATEEERVAGTGWTTKAEKSLRRYRVAALVTGVMLLILCVELVLKYVVQVGDDVMRWIGWVPFAHGWIYVLYLVTVMDLWSTMRWGFRRLASMVFAGVVPVMSFVVERRVHADGERLIAAGRPAPRGAVPVRDVDDAGAVR